MPTFESSVTQISDLVSTIPADTDSGAYGAHNIRNLKTAVKTLNDSGGSAQVGFIQSGTGATSRTVQKKLRDIVNVKDFGVTADGTTDDTTNIQAALNSAATLSSRSRNSAIYLSPGKYLFTNLNINQAEAGSTHGRIVICGAGPINTELVSSAATGDALTIKGGRVALRDFTVGATGSRLTGSGNGIVLDSGDATPSVAQIIVENVAVQNQPGDGFKFRNGEMVQMSNCVADTCGGHGFSFYADTIGGIANMLMCCRAISCTGNALRMDGTSESTAICFEALDCGSTTYPEAIFSNSRNFTLINPDVEAKTKSPGTATTGVASLVGIRLTSGQIIRGLVSGFDRGIWCSGSGPLVIEYPHFTNSGYPSAMTRAVELNVIPTGRIRLLDSYTSVTNICTLTGYTSGADIVVGASRLGQYLSAAAAPTSNANWVGQFYKNTSNGNFYVAIATGTGASDWQQIA